MNSMTDHTGPSEPSPGPLPVFGGGGGFRRPSPSRPVRTRRRGTVRRPLPGRPIGQTNVSGTVAGVTA